MFVLASSSCPKEPTNSSFAPMFPTVSPNVTLSLTIFYLTMYILLFLVVYTQLWLILKFNYKRFSFQSVFLYLCACWSGLRATLFSFYFYNTVQANTLSIFWYWLLYCFPVCLQFCTLCLLNLYFAQVMFKSKAKYAANPLKYKCPLRTVCILAIIVFLTMNITCAFFVQQQMKPQVEAPKLDTVSLLITLRVVINDLLFVVFAILLSYSIIKISKTTSANILLEAKGTSVCQAVTIGFMIVLLYLSRAVYNIIAVSPLRCHGISSFDFDWYNVSDQADQVELKDLPYVVFGVVLFVWELLPTGLVIFFFRVKKPENPNVSGSVLNSQSYNSRVYFFDNPHRYDSDEEALQQSSWQNENTSSARGLDGRNSSSASFNGASYQSRMIGNGLLNEESPRSSSSIHRHSYTHKYSTNMYKANLYGSAK